MASDDERILGKGLTVIAIVVLYAVLIVLDQDWGPWEADPATLPDPSVAVLAVATGVVAGVFTLALVLKFDRFLVAGVTVVVPLFVLLYIAVHIVFEIEEADAVRTLVSHSYTVITVVIPIAFALVFDLSSDAPSD